MGADTGIGIPAAVQPQLFTRFLQGDRSTWRKFGGRGELMRGSLRVTSPPHQGSRFTVTLPVVAAGEAAPAAGSGELQPRRPRSLRVLIAEDNTTNQVVALGLLRKLGYDDVSLAHDGIQACEMGVGNQFDLILMDCQMPEMDGYEATRRLRAAGCTSVVVAMTATAIRGDRERCIEAGMDDYLTKPLELKVLRAVLTRWAQPEGTRPPSGGTALPVFARESMRGRFGGDCELEEVAVESFRRSMPPLLARLQAALASGNRVQVRLLAHSAKGAGAMICAERYAAIAGAMEDRAEDAPLDELVRLRGQLQRAFDEFVMAVAAALVTASLDATSTASSAGPGSPDRQPP